MSHSIDHTKDILESAPDIFREAIENLVDTWEDSYVDVSCIVTAFVDARWQIETLEFENDELSCQVSDLERQVVRLTEKIEALEQIVMIISQSQRKAG